MPREPIAVTLRFKLLVLVAGVALLSATGVTTVALWREVEQLQEHLSCEGTAVASSIASAAPRWLGPDGPLPGASDALAPVLERALVTTPLLRAWVVDRTGRVAACADRTGRGCPPRAPTAFRTAQGPHDMIYHLMNEVPLEATAPIVRNGEVTGAVRVSYLADSIVADARRLAGGAALIASVWIALGMLFGTVLVRHFTRPLSEVVRAADALSAGDRIEIQGRTDPELRDLVAAFNRMSTRVRESQGERENLIASLNERVALATKEGLRAERLASLGAIAAGFAHEMGNSLNVIAGFTAVVLREVPAGDVHRTDLEAVRRESARAAALLERFLFFARARSAHRERQPLEPIVRESVEVIGPAAASARVITEVSVEPGLPLVRLDAELLRQAFVNLCLNAVQAMEGGGKLSVRALKEDGGVAVEFQDTGKGIDAAARDHIFEPFFTTKPNGTGLGLAIVRQAAEANGGSVELSSEPGKGALFRVRLPAAEACA